MKETTHLYFIISLCVFIVRGHPLVPPDMHADPLTFRYKSSEVPFVTSWPLKAGFPGLVIYNLNEYLSLFPQCLVVVYNHQGIEMTEWTVPIYLQRFDVAVQANSADRFIKNNMTRVIARRIDFEKIPQIQDFENLRFYEKDHVKFSESKWYCYVQFDIYFPEKADAFHFYFQRRPKYINGRYFYGNS